MQPYPLPAAHLGVEHVTILDHVVTGTVLSIPRLNEQALQMEVTLEADPLNHMWKVRSPFGIIGFLDADESAEFPDLDRVLASHLTPVTWATVEIVDNDIEVAVHLGLNVWQVPRNNQPVGSVLLSGSRGYLIDTLASEDVDDFQWNAMGTCQLIVALHIVGDHIVASVDDVVLGSVLKSDALPHVKNVLAQASEQGAVVCARAYVAQGSMAVDLPSVHSAEVFAAALPQLTVPHDKAIIPLKESELPNAHEFELAVAAEIVAAESPAPTGSRTVALASRVEEDLPEPELEPEPVNEPEPEPEPESEPEPVVETEPNSEPEDESSSTVAPTTASASADTHQLANVAGFVRALPEDRPSQSELIEGTERYSSESARVRQRRLARRRRRGHHRK